MVAVPRDADGAPVGGIHRTFLLDDGSAQGAGGQEDAGLGRRTVRFGCSRSAPTVISASPRASRPRFPRRRSSACRSGPRSPPTAWRAGSGRPTSGASRSSPTPAMPADRRRRGSPTGSISRTSRTRSSRRSMATTSTTTCSAAPSRRTMRRLAGERRRPRRAGAPLPMDRALRPRVRVPSWKPPPRR